MKHNRKTATVLAGITLVASIAVGCIAFAFLPGQFVLTLACVIVGFVATGIVFLLVSKLPDSRYARAAAVAFFALLGSLPLLSAIAPRITFAKFGVTVYGAVPIPVLDVTIDQNGVLWFRSKTHRITREELEILVTPDVEVIVVGIGWDSVARLTGDAIALGANYDLRVLPTPDALAMYNTLKAQGRKVVLLAHSTC